MLTLTRSESYLIYIIFIMPLNANTILKANIEQMETMLGALRKLRAFARTAEQKKSLDDAIKQGEKHLVELKKRVVN